MRSPYPLFREVSIASLWFSAIFTPKVTPVSFIKKDGATFGATNGPQGSNHSVLLVTFHNTTHDKGPDQFCEVAFEPQLFIQMFRQFSKNVITEKEANYLFH